MLSLTQSLLGGLCEFRGFYSVSLEYFGYTLVCWSPRYALWSGQEVVRVPEPSGYRTLDYHRMVRVPATQRWDPCRISGLVLLVRECLNVVTAVINSDSVDRELRYSVLGAKSRKKWICR
jgi:hypothetical protein